MDKKEEYFNVKDILCEAKQIYSINSDDHDAALKAYIQHFLTNYCKENNYRPKDLGEAGKALYYERKVVDALLSNKKVIHYFTKKHSSLKTYKKNIQLAYGEKSELDAKKQSLLKKWEQAGLTEEEGNKLEFDKLTSKQYLTVDELIVLGLEGMIPRSSLSDVDKDRLKWFHDQEILEEEEIKRTEQLLYLKKIEIMLSAIFNEEYKLDEEKLRRDILNVIRGGEYSPLITNNGFIEDQNPEQAVRRSYKNLQSCKNYYKKKR